MISGKRIGKVYEEIQKKICNMIPEKWEKVYLYVSIIKGTTKLETGEMFFYYYPKGVIKKNPINVYEIPSKFNLDDEMYLKLADSLYREIQRLKEIMVKNGEESWTNLTISIENCQFKVEFDYEDLRKSSFTNIERNLIWQFKYLKKDIGAYRRKERKILEKYMEMESFNPRRIKTYSEPFYLKPETNIVDYNTEYKEKLKKLAAEEDEKERQRKEKLQAKKEELLRKKKIEQAKKMKIRKEKMAQEKKMSETKRSQEKVIKPKTKKILTDKEKLELQKKKLLAAKKKKM